MWISILAKRWKHPKNLKKTTYWTTKY